jgi:hypothetical protein
MAIALLDVAGNPAINAIPPNATFSDKVTPACLQTDQRGVKRPQGPACDIGAYEYRAPTIGVPGNMIAQTQSRSGAPVTYSSPMEGTLPDNPAVMPTLACVNARPLSSHHAFTAARGGPQVPCRRALAQRRSKDARSRVAGDSAGRGVDPRPAAAEPAGARAR